MISFEEFEEKLISIGGEIMHDNKFFNRKIKVNALGVEVIFEWYKNLCNAYIGNICICWFNDITIDGCFPNHFKTNINLVRDKKKIAIVPIENYKSD